ncbi:hypothetical protein [Sinomonas halotolerans]|uniref:Flagellar FliJ protein n=1 Tax=Sinomonas halotolerans TaxID=1644133 RepID=A0ABU9WYQ9_9MICC
MSPLFRLEGLLRIRQAQRDETAGRLAGARATLGDARAQLEARRAEDGRGGLGRATGTAAPEDTDDGAALTAAAALRAVAAARGAQSRLLADLAGLVAQREAEAESLAAEYEAAALEAARLERLEERHRTAAKAAELGAEQTALDDIAGGRPARREGRHA